MLDGCRVYTTAEIVLGELPQLAFRRETDATFGYQELVIWPAVAGAAGPGETPAAPPAPARIRPGKSSPKKR